jgi:hypothetical protein
MIDEWEGGRGRERGKEGVMEEMYVDFTSRLW